MSNKYEKLVKPRLHDIENWIREGATEEEVTKKIGISRRSFYAYKQEYPELEGAVLHAKADTDYQIIGALMKSAIGGGTVSETKIEERDGKKVTVTTIKQLPPNVDAAKFLLTNRRPEEFKNRQDTKQETETILRLENYEEC